MSVVPSDGRAEGDPDLRFLAGLGVLTGEVSPELAGEVVEAAGVREKRRRLLPAVTVVYLVLGMCLLSGADSMGPPGYRSVMRQLTHGLRQLHGGAAATRQAFTKARQRLGCKALELLFDRVRGPRAWPGLAGASAFGRLLVSWDGTDLDVPGTRENRAAFGCHAGGGPKLRLVSLIECGTHAVIDAAFDSFARVSEHVLARRVLASLQPGMLLLGDRLFPGHELWGLAAGTGADLLWRARNNLVFTVARELADGSYLAVMATPAENSRSALARHRGRALPRIPDGHLIRVIEYTLTVTAPDGTRASEQFRLLTTLLDPGEAPAAALAALYRQRWESENGTGELKTRLRGAGFTLRSRTPDLACQEMLAFLIVCQALCGLRARAAASAGIDPDRLSFTVTLRTARDYATSWQGPATLARACRNATADILSDQLGPRRNRQCDRVTSPPPRQKKYKTRDQPGTSRNVTYTINLTTSRPPPASANP